MSDPKAELAVKKLARLPTNTTCPNCGQTKKLGFSNVCIKFYTFVCNDCKSSHQAYSHRCKSLTMSSWDAEEAKALKRHGNDVARKTWLAKAPPIGVGGRPKQGDALPVFKQFILNAYEHKKYYAEAQEDETVQDNSQDLASFQTNSGNQKKAKSVVSPAPLRAPPKSSENFASFPPSAPLQSGESDSNFASFPPPSAIASSAPAPDLFANNNIAVQTNDNVFDPFGNNAPQKTEAALFAPVANAEESKRVSNGGFAGFDPFGNSNNTKMSASGAGSLADLTMPPQNPTSQPTQSIMANNSGNSISAMGYFTNSAAGQQQHNNMVFQNSFGSTNNNMAFGMNTQMNQSNGMTQQQMMMHHHQMNTMQNSTMQQQPNLNMMMQQQQQSNLNTMMQQQQQPVMMSTGSSTGVSISAMTPQSAKTSQKKDPFSGLF